MTKRYRDPTGDALDTGDSEEDTCNACGKRGHKRKSSHRYEMRLEQRPGRMSVWDASVRGLVKGKLPSSSRGLRMLL